MNKKFTKLMAAIALLTFLAVPMGMWGQSRESITASYGWEDADDANQWTISSAIIKTSGQGNTGTYAGKINTNTTTVQYNDKVNVTSFSYALKRTSTNSNYSVYIQTSTDGQTWNTVDTHAMSSFGNGTYTTVTKTFDGNTAYYVRFYCSNTTATRYVDDVTIVYNTTASTTFTVNYDCNGGETDCPENVSGIAPGTSITLASAPSRLHYNFVGWTYGATTYNPGDSYTVNSNVTFIAQWEPDGTYGEGSICFSSQSSCTAINSQSVTSEDDLGNTWTITTVGTNSFTSNSGYYQVGSGNNPATSITFTTTLDEEVNVTDFSAMFGGFSATRASVVIKVDDTQVGSGTLNGAADVTVSSSSAQIGTTLTVVVTPTAGGVKCYNISYAYETINNPAVATTTTINVPQDFNTDIYQGATAGTLTATVKDNENNTIIGATVTWSSSNTGVATINANGEVTLVAVGTTTITASYAGVEDQYRPSEGTYELTVTNSNAPGTQNNPYTVAQAIAATPSSGTSDNVYIHGIVSRFHNNSIVGDGTNYRYYISDDGTSSTELLVYKGKGLNNVAFSNANDLLVGDEVTICGGLTTYNSTKEVAANNYIVSLVRPAQYTLTNAMTNVSEYLVFVGETEIEFDNNNQAQVRAGATVYVSLTMEDCYGLTSLTVNGSTTGVTEIEPGVYYSFVMPEGDATIGVSATQATPYTLTVVGGENVSFNLLVGSSITPAQLTNGTVSICKQLHVTIDDLTVPTGFVLEPITLTYGNTTEEVNPAVGFTMPSSNATLTFTTHEAETFTYTKVTSVTPGKHYIIVTASASNGEYHAMGGKHSGGSYMDPIVVSVDNNTVTVAENEGVAEILIDLTGSKYTLHTSEGYLVGGNKLMDTNGSEESTWGISFDDDQAIITWTINTTEYSIQYNSANPRFACYSSSQAKVCLYEKNEPATETYTLTINGYGNDINVKTGWNLIASPVAVDPASIQGMTIESTASNYDSFDLYQFNANPTPVDGVTKEWENWKQQGAHYNFSLVPGKGYLYANANTVNLTFTGVMNGDFEDVELPYDANDDIKSLYLAGNSKTMAETFFVYDGNLAKQTVNFLTLNDDGNGFITTSANSFTVDEMHGFFVQSGGENRTLSTTDMDAKSGTPELLNVMVSQNRGALVDNAIVSFGNAPLMSKFYLSDNSTRVFIQQNGEEMAVVRTEAQGEMPVNFRANENGQYTLTVNPEGVEMGYLHLIDNMTGADIDLLANPSYSFNAKTTDYESRFRLVFAANNNNNEDGPSTGSTTFAFFSNGSWIINNEGEATLQVIDLNGRILSSETINGSVSTSLNATTGIYMMRLINGDNVKTQKVVVR